MNRYTTTQVGQRLGLTRQTIITRIHDGVIKAYRDPYNNRFYVLPKDLEKYAQESGLPLFPWPEKTKRSKAESERQAN
jgi:hypothetical protein